MHLLTTPLLYRILTFQASPQRTKIVGVILLTLFTLVMAVHMVMDEFILHAVTFGLAVYLIATRTLKIILQQVSDPSIRRSLRNLTYFGFCMFPLYPTDIYRLKCYDQGIADDCSLLRLWLFCVAD